jgi:hypothetical protein
MTNATDIGSYIPARDAALRARLHPDYIARLARQSKIKAKQVGRKWYVEQSALDAFLKDHSESKKNRREQLREKHKREYIQHAKPENISHVVEEKIVETVPPRARHAVVTTVKHANLWASPGVNAQAMTYAIHPGVDLFHRAIALITAVVLVFGAYGVIDREFGAAAIDALAYTASGAVAFTAVTLGFSPDCSSGTQRMAAAAHVAFGNLVTSIDNALPSGLQDAPLTPIDSACSR